MVEDGPAAEVGLAVAEVAVASADLAVEAEEVEVPPEGGETVSSWQYGSRQYLFESFFIFIEDANCELVTANCFRFAHCPLINYFPAIFPLI